MKIKITGGTLLLHDKEGFKTVNDTLFVKDGLIEGIGKVADETGYEVFDAKDKLVMPGLINMHTHGYMTFLRN